MAKVGAPAEDAPLGSVVHDQRPLPSGDDVEVSITVTGPDGNPLGDLAEERGVPDGGNGCNCVVLTYQWANGKVGRFAGEPTSSTD